MQYFFILRRFNVFLFFEFRYAVDYLLWNHFTLFILFLIFYPPIHSVSSFDVSLFFSALLSSFHPFVPFTPIYISPHILPPSFSDGVFLLLLINYPSLSSACILHFFSSFVACNFVYPSPSCPPVLLSSYLSPYLLLSSASA